MTETERNPVGHPASPTPHDPDLRHALRLRPHRAGYRLGRHPPQLDLHPRARRCRPISSRSSPSGPTTGSRSWPEPGNYDLQRSTAKTDRRSTTPTTATPSTPTAPARPQSFSFGNPDFNVKSLRGTIVLRWEYLPGFASLSRLDPEPGRLRRPRRPPAPARHRRPADRPRRQHLHVQGLLPLEPLSRGLRQTAALSGTGLPYQPTAPSTSALPRS